MDKKKLFLIDGAALFYRSYFAFIRNPLINSKGENTSAPYGFVNAVLRLVAEEKPEYLAVVFDTPEPTFRHKLYPDYKATREKMPDEMRDQFPRILEFLRLTKIPAIELEGYEADDIIGTISVNENRDDLDIYMMTGDKDFMQLIRPGVFMYSQGKSGGKPEIIDKAGVENKFGVKPEQVIDILGLMGDSSDNVPGVPGIGPKTAQKLIAEFGSMENLYENIGRLKPSKMKENLSAFKDQAFLSKKLVTIDCKVPVDYAVENFAIETIDSRAAEGWFKEMEFNSLWRKMGELSLVEKKAASLHIGNIDKRYLLVNDTDTLNSMLDELTNHEIIAFDTETTGLSLQDDKLIGASFCAAPGFAWYVDLDEERVEPETREKLLTGIKEVLESGKIRKVAQNAKFDIQVLWNVGINVGPIYFDTMLAAYLLDSNDNHNMDHLAERYLNYKTITYKELTGDKGSPLFPEKVDLQKLKDYAAEDADVTYRLYEHLSGEIKREGMEELLQKLEIPLSLVLAEMEKNGVKLDTKMLADYSLELGKKLDALAENLYREAGKKFNLNSPSQLGPILFEELEVHHYTGTKRIPKTKTGKYSTAENILQKFAEHPFVAGILEYRKLTKLKSTYVDALPRLISPSTGLLHTSYNQTVTATGRLSSSDPNLQNIPIRSEEGKVIRAAFIARESGRKILSADYSQVELRIMAALSRDKNMLEAFAGGEDIHRSTAAKIFHVSPDEVDENMRRKAKEVNFGIIYGISQYGLARRLGISNMEAQQFIQSYFAVYPDIQRFMAETIALASETGYVETILKRKRHIPELKSSNRQTFENGQRIAVNSRIQGSAADLIKRAMIDIHKAVETDKIDALMILQVHDELVFDVAEKDLPRLEKLVRDKMENAIELAVPLKVDMGSGNNWLEAH
jgi:DNA polymerase-1